MKDWNKEKNEEEKRKIEDEIQFIRKRHKYKIGNCY